jgi:hypothetical protein
VRYGNAVIVARVGNNCQSITRQSSA